MNTYTAGQFAKRVGNTVKTLQRWDREGTLQAKRTNTNRRYYTEEDVHQVLRIELPPEEKISLVYCRVSSQAQKPDLRNQREVLETFTSARGISDVTYIEEVGGGMNFKRKKFRAIMSDVYAGKVGQLIVAHKDRLARFGFEHIKWCCEQHGCEVIVLNNETLSPEREMVEDLMTIVHCFSSRLYGLRNYKKTLKDALK